MYLTALCAIDFVSTVFLIPSVVYQLVDDWLLGSFVCKLHMVVESSGKVSTHNRRQIISRKTRDRDCRALIVGIMEHSGKVWDFHYTKYPVF